MNEEMIERAVERLAALADATRMRIMMRLREGECNVSGLSAELQVAQPSVSKHLGVLRHAGLISVRHEGAQAFYFVRDDSVFGICDVLCGAIRRQQNEDARALGAKPRRSRSARR